MNVKKLAWIVVVLTLLQPISSRKRTKSKSRKCYGQYTCQRATQPGASKKCVCIDISQFCDQARDCPNGEDESNCSCQSLSNPENGNVMQSGSDHNSVATYTCKPGFLLVGDPARTCMTNNKWSGTQPTCNKIVDGGWANWGEFSTCSHTCGCGLKIRFRSCTNPRPAEGEMDCVGDAAEAMKCTLRNCPVDGVWSEWSKFSLCSSSCDAETKGMQIRTRSCTNPSPSDDGALCSGLSTETKECDFSFCPLTEWSPWSTCKCIGGGMAIQTRTRSCPDTILPCFAGEQDRPCTVAICVDPQ